MVAMLKNKFSFSVFQFFQNFGIFVFIFAKFLNIIILSKIPVKYFKMKLFIDSGTLLPPIIYLHISLYFYLNIVLIL